MRRLNQNKIRIEDQKAVKNYIAFGERVFLKALKDQAENYQDFDPSIMEDAYLRFYERVFVDSAKRGLKRIKVNNQKNFIQDAFFLTTWRAWIRDYVQNDIIVRKLISNVNERTLKEIATALAAGIENGDTFSNLAGSIKKFVGNSKRAAGIAITESTRANAVGQQRSAQDWSKETGTELWKLWIHSKNFREPRNNHIALQNRPIPASEVFENGLDKPGDPTAPPSETVRCQCIVVYVSRDYVEEYYPSFLAQSTEASPLPIQIQIGENIDSFIPAKTLEEVNERLSIFGKVNINDISLDSKNQILQSAEEILGLMPNKRMIEGFSYQKDFKRSVATATTRERAGTGNVEIVSMNFKKTFLKNPIEYTKEQTTVFENSIVFRKNDIEKFLKIPNLPNDVIERKLDQLKVLNTYKSWAVFEKAKRPVYTVATHENGHALFNVKKLESKWLANLKKNNVTLIDKQLVSEYGASDMEELFCEVLAAYKSNIPIPKNIIQALIETIN